MAEAEGLSQGQGRKRGEKGRKGESYVCDVYVRGGLLDAKESCPEKRSRLRR
jgi:hypothetical protein